MEDASFCSDFAFDVNVTPRSSVQKRAHPTSQRSQTRSQDSLRSKSFLNTTQAIASFGFEPPDSDSDVSTTPSPEQQPRVTQRNKSQAPNLPLTSAEEVGF
ncbi:hypothetical protein M3Y98_00002400 [Aphelenchoides besseyi]|nr:hypothetical protein M3Y98_00002400 [Aphelenchoides besseyi]